MGEQEQGGVGLRGNLPLPWPLNLWLFLKYLPNAWYSWMSYYEQKLVKEVSCAFLADGGQKRDHHRSVSEWVRSRGFRAVQAPQEWSEVSSRRLWNLQTLQIIGIIDNSILFVVNWRIITLQHYLGFCHTSTWISHTYTYVSSLLNLHPAPLGCHRALVWVPWVTQQIPTGSLFYKWYCICFHATLSINPLLPLSPCLHVEIIPL